MRDPRTGQTIVPGLGRGLLQQGLSGAPVQHPFQALARILMARKGMGMIGEEQARGEAERQQMADLLAPMPQPDPAAQFGGGPIPVPAMGPGKIDGVPGMTPPTPATMAPGMDRAQMEQYTGGPIAEPQAPEADRNTQVMRAMLLSRDPKMRGAAMQRLMGQGEPFTLGPGQVRYGAGGRVIARGGPDPKKGSQQFIQAKRLRDEFVKQSKVFVQVRDSYNRIRAAKASAAGDIAMIFNYMKMLDPGSTVREGEFATAQNATGVPQRIRNMWNRMKAGERLAPVQRKDFLSQSEALYQQQLGSHNQLRNTYGNLAASYGLKPERIVTELRPGAGWSFGPDKKKKRRAPRRRPVASRAAQPPVAPVMPQAPQAMMPSDIRESVRSGEIGGMEGARRLIGGLLR